MASVCSCTSCTAQVADVLQLVVQHNHGANDPQTLCSLLQVSTAVRRMLQQTRGHCWIHTTHLGGDWNRAPDTARVVGFAAWLLRHSGLVSSICLHTEEDPSLVSSLALTAALTLCCHLGMSTRQHAAATAEGATAAADTGGAGSLSGTGAVAVAAAATGSAGAPGAALLSATPPPAVAAVPASATEQGAASVSALSPPAAAGAAGGMPSAALVSASPAEPEQSGPAPALLDCLMLHPDVVLTAATAFVKAHLYFLQGPPNAERAALAAAAVPCDVNPPVQEQWPLPLRLDEFYGDRFLANHEVLLALQQAGVSELHLSCAPSQATAWFSQALAGLTSLQSLWLNTPLEDCALPSSVAAALGQLPKLVSLDTGLEPAAVRLLPPHVTCLTIHLWPGEAGGTDADFSHMTQLDYLRYSSPDDSFFSVKLPSQLEAIQMFGPITKLTGHSKLRYIEFHPGLPSHLAVLRYLADLPHEWYLQLNLECDQAVLPGFQQQQQQQQQQAVMQGLQQQQQQQQQQGVDEADGYQEALQARVRELQQGAAYLGSCRMLTKLELGLTFVWQCRELIGRLNWCQQLAKLTQLWSLTLTMQKPELDDLTHLTALKSLHSLELNNIPPDAPCELITTVLAKMNSLRSLTLRCDPFTSLQQLSATSSLTCLTKLQLTHWHAAAAMCDADFALLTSLQKLRDLTLPLVQQCSDKARLQFEASMPQLARFFRWQLP